MDVKSALAVKVAILVAILLIAAQPRSAAYRHHHHDMETKDIVPTVVRPIYDFTGKLFGTINKRGAEKEPKNVVLSPISIHKALSMTLLGTDHQSETQRQLLDTIGFANLSESEIQKCHEDYAKILSNFKQITQKTLRDIKDYEAKNQSAHSQDDSDDKVLTPIMDLFNMVVTKNRGQIKPNYEHDVQKYYNASVSNIDDKKPETKSQLLKQLNDWAKEAGFDNPIISEGKLDEDFEALLLSAIRVEAFWFENFHESEVKDVFYNYGLEDKPVKGQQLSRHDIRSSKYIEFTSTPKYKRLHARQGSSDTFKELSSLNFHVAEIPLHGELSFTIFEPLDGFNSPSEGANFKLNKLIEELFSCANAGRNPDDKFRQTKLDITLQLLDGVGSYESIDYLSMPRFKFENDINLKPILESLGLVKVFDDHRAEISNITENKVYISDIKHLAVIDVTKSGIKAAGVTMVQFALLSAYVTQEPIRVNIQKPFMFLIRYKKIPLFVGQLTHL